MKSPASPSNNDMPNNDLLLLIDEVQDYAIILLDPEGNITSWNKGAQAIKGYTAEEAIGKNYAMFYTLEDIEAGRPKLNLMHAKANGRFLKTGYRVRKDGSLFWADMVITALYNKDGSIRGFAKITRDISEQKKLRCTCRRSSF